MTMEEQQQHHLHDASNTNAGNKQATKETRQPFPVKVYEMLEDADSKGFAHIVSWNSPGDGFMVYKKDSFINQIAPLYFHLSKYKVRFVVVVLHLFSCWMPFRCRSLLFVSLNIILILFTSLIAYNVIHRVFNDSYLCMGFNE